MPRDDFFRFLDICVMGDDCETQLPTKGELFLMAIVGIGLITVKYHL